MPSEEEFEELKGRIVELENQLAKGGAARGAVAEVSEEELKAFVKVRDVLVFTDWGENCGINECFKCIVVQPCTTLCIQRCIVTCIVECTCGPCLQGGGLPGGVGRFGGLGA